MANARKRTRRSLSPASNSDDDRSRPPPPRRTSQEDRVFHVQGEHEFPEGPDVQIIGETDPPDSERDDDVPVRILTDFSIYNDSTLELVPIACLLELSINPSLILSAAGCVKAWIDNDDQDDEDDDDDDDQDQEGAERARESSADDDPTAEDRIQRLKLTRIKRFSFHDLKKSHRRLDRCSSFLSLYIRAHIP